jgi:hypothetical protein
MIFKPAVAGVDFFPFFCGDVDNEEFDEAVRESDICIDFKLVVH